MGCSQTKLNGGAPPRAAATTTGALANASSSNNSTTVVVRFLLGEQTPEDRRRKLAGMLVEFHRRGWGRAAWGSEDEGHGGGSRADDVLVVWRAALPPLLQQRVPPQAARIVALVEEEEEERGEWVNLASPHPLLITVVTYRSFGEDRRKMWHTILSPANQGSNHHHHHVVVKPLPRFDGAHPPHARVFLCGLPRAHHRLMVVAGELKMLFGMSSIVLHSGDNVRELMNSGGAGDDGDGNANASTTTAAPASSGAVKRILVVWLHRGVFLDALVARALRSAASNAIKFVFVCEDGDEATLDFGALTDEAKSRGLGSILSQYQIRQAAVPVNPAILGGASRIMSAASLPRPVLLPQSLDAFRVHRETPRILRLGEAREDEESSAWLRGLDECATRAPVITVTTAASNSPLSDASPAPGDDGDIVWSRLLCLRHEGLAERLHLPANAALHDEARFRIGAFHSFRGEECAQMRSGEVCIRSIYNQLSGMVCGFASSMPADALELEHSSSMVDGSSASDLSALFQALVVRPAQVLSESYYSDRETALLSLRCAILLRDVDQCEDTAEFVRALREGARVLPNWLVIIVLHPHGVSSPLSHVDTPCVTLESRHLSGGSSSSSSNNSVLEGGGQSFDQVSTDWLASDQNVPGDVVQRMLRLAWDLPVWCNASTPYIPLAVLSRMFAVSATPPAYLLDERGCIRRPVCALGNGTQREGEDADAHTFGETLETMVDEFISAQHAKGEFALLPDRNKETIHEVALAFAVDNRVLGLVRGSRGNEMRKTAVFGWFTRLGRLWLLVQRSLQESQFPDSLLRILYGLARDDDGRDLGDDVTNEEEVVRVLAHVLRSAKRALLHDVRELCGQILARIDPDSTQSPLLRALVGEASQFARTCKVRLATPSVFSGLEQIGDVGRVFEHSSSVFACTMHASSRTLVTAAWDGKVRLLDARTGAVKCVLDAHDMAVLSVVVVELDGDDRASPSWGIVSASADHTIRGFLVCNASAGTCVLASTSAAVAVHTGKVNMLTHSPSRSLLASASDDGTIGLFRVNANARQVDLTPLRTLPCGGAPVTCVCVDESGTRVAGGTANRNALVFDCESGSVIFALQEAHSSPVRSVAFHENRFIATGGDDRSIVVWDFATGVPVHTVRNAHGDSVTSVHFARAPVPKDEENANGTPVQSRVVVVSGSLDETIRVWDVFTSPSCACELQPKSHKLKKPHHAVVFAEIVRDAHSGVIRSVVSCSADDKSCVRWCGLDGLLAAEAPEEANDALDRRRPHAMKVTCVAVSQNRAVTGSVDKTAIVWDVDSRARVAVLPHKETVYSVAIAANRVVTGALLETRLWDIDTATTLHVFRGHTNVVFAVAISRDCARVASLSYDGMRMWETDSKELVLDGNRANFDCIEPVDMCGGGGGGQPHHVQAWDVENGVGFTPDVGADDLRRIDNKVFGPAGNSFALWYL